MSRPLSLMLVLLASPSLADAPVEAEPTDTIPSAPPARPSAPGAVWVSPLGYEMAWIPAGRFVMGSPRGEPDRSDDEAQHEVELTRGFWMGTAEVTQDLWRDVTRDAPSSFRGCGGRCPVESVSWADAVAFANALSEREGLEPCYALSGEAVSWPRWLDCEGYRLPTEAEWEYAARAGDRGRYAGSSELEQAGWFRGNAGDGPREVGQKEPNAWGLYDMTGNVWEWVWDQYGDYPDAATDPVGSSSGGARCLRGGSWGNRPRHARIAARLSFAPSFRDAYIGLRLVRQGEPLGP